MILSIFVTVNFIYSVGENTYCAERTVDGAWCQNVPLEDVDKNYRYVPASCEATSYCKLGTCVNSQEGTCLENTPQKVCEEPEDGIKGGIWYDKSQEELPQCSLGCCVLGDQAAFVTQVRCNQLSSLYGLEVNYRTDIKSEVACISTVSSQNKGACVFDQDFQRTCKFTTQEECNKVKSTTTNSSVEFHEGLLCSAEELATNCGPSEKTTLIDGKDEVYFVDTCGNIANIYDASKINNQNYWREIVDKADSCGFNAANGNAGSKTCGNCDYFLGSTGKLYDRSVDTATPQIGNYICRDLSCEYNGKEYQHGETWCSPTTDESDNSPGSRYFRNVCYNGEVTVEPCADFRQEVCIQSDIDGFSTAACRVNRWQDCTSQDKKADCENTDRRDCKWVEGKRFDGEQVSNSDKQGSCLPKYTPGSNFWEAQDSTETLCLLGSKDCKVVYEKTLLGSWECKENCDCLDSSWKEKQNNLCLALGDCGSSTNFIGKEGYYNLNDLTETNANDNKTNSN